MPLETALVVDDSKSARIMLSRMLQKMGLTVEACESGEDAIAFLANSAHPQVIFMDHMMPGMDGLEATRQLSQNPVTSHIPIYMYTSKEGPEYEASLMASGATGMLGKPAKPDRLREIIADLSAAIDTASSDPSADVASSTAEPAPQSVAMDNQEPRASMNKELIAEIAKPLIAEALEEALAPLAQTLQAADGKLLAQVEDLKALEGKLASLHDVVSQPVLDAAIHSLSNQITQQVEDRLKALRLEFTAQPELSDDALASIIQSASEAGAQAGAQQAADIASSSAEATAAKVAAAQAQVQLEQALPPAIQSLGAAKALSVAALVVAAAALLVPFIL